MRRCGARVMQPERYDARQERFIALFSTTPQPFPVQFGRQWREMRVLLAEADTILDSQ
jgi:hypothetical protein